MSFEEEFNAITLAELEASDMSVLKSEESSERAAISESMQAVAQLEAASSEFFDKDQGSKL